MCWHWTSCQIKASGVSLSSLFCNFRHDKLCEFLFISFHSFHFNLILFQEKGACYWGWHWPWRGVLLYRSWSSIVRIFIRACNTTFSFFPLNSQPQPYNYQSTEYELSNCEHSNAGIFFTVFKWTTDLNRINFTSVIPKD